MKKWSYLWISFI